MITTAHLSALSKEFWNQAYTGREFGCRCGCHGKYFEYGGIGFKRALNKAYRLNPEIVLCDNEDELNANASRIQDEVERGKRAPKGFGLSRNGRIAWIDIVLPDDSHLKTITLYT